MNFTVNGVTKATDADGEACFDGLAFGQYDVTETLPAGYAADGPLTKRVTVDNTATCLDDPFGGETVSFSSTPLSSFTVSVDSQVDGGTTSTINCVNSSAATVASGSTGANGDGSATANNQPRIRTPARSSSTRSADDERVHPADTDRRGPAQPAPVI